MDPLEIKIARIRAGLRQYQLADKLGISDSKLSLIESGRDPLPPTLLPRLRDVLGSYLGSEVTNAAGHQ